MKVVVSGATGFLGGYVLRSLKEDGVDVIGTSRKVNRPQQGIQRIETLDQMPEADVLVHFSESNNRFQVNELGASYVQELEGRTKLLTKKYPRIVYASSIAVYDDRRSELRRPEEVLSPTDIYSEAKLLAERIVLSSGPSTVARIANAYGPGMSSLNVISRVLEQFLAGKPEIELISSDPVRDYIWYSDIVDAIKCMTMEGKPGTFNVATGVGKSVGEICDLVAKILSYKKYTIRSQKDMKTSRIVMDINATVETFAWRPQTDLQTGLSKLIHRMRT